MGHGCRCLRAVEGRKVERSVCAGHRLMVSSCHVARCFRRVKPFEVVTPVTWHTVARWAGAFLVFGGFALFGVTAEA